MAPKRKGTASGKDKASSLVPAVDSAALQRAQHRYKQAINKPVKSLANIINEELRDDNKGDFMSLLVRARLVLDKKVDLHKELKDRKKVEKKGDAFSRLVEGVFTSLPAGTEVGPTAERISLSYIVARAGLLALLAEERYDDHVSVEAAEQCLEYVARHVQMGFSKEGWAKIWYDPKSEQVAEAKEASSTVMAAELFIQLQHICKSLMRPWGVQLKEMAITLEDYKEHSAQLEKIKAHPGMVEAQAVLEASQTSATEQQGSKQVQGNKQQEKLDARRLQEQLQQPHQRGGRAGRDTDRVRDAKRGKPAPENNKKLLDLQRARDEEKKNAEEAAKVFDFLQDKVLGDGITPEEHIRRLQSHTTVNLDALKQVVKELNASKDTKDKDKEPLPLQHCKQQLGDVNPNDALLQAQLKALASQGVWQLYLDEAAAHGKSGKQLTWSSWQDFEDHVMGTYLDGKVQDEMIDGISLAFPDAPSMHDAYTSEDLLAQPDAAADAVWHGKAHAGSPWMEAFSKECPLQRFLRSYGDLPTEEFFSAATAVPTDDEDETAKTARLSTAMGFALLQMQRQQVAVDPLKLSHKPRWAVLAYYALRLFEPLHFDYKAEPDHFMAYSYWRSKACMQDYELMLWPHMVDQPEAASAGNGASDPAPSHSDGLAEDNTTMLSMLHADKLLVGPLLLAVQLFLQRAERVCLDVKAKQFHRAALGVLEGLELQQQLELRQFLCQVLYHANANLSACREFMKVMQEQRMRPQAVPVLVQEGKNGITLTLSPDYYEQACLAAAMPVETNTACCFKHHTMRVQAEAEGKAFSRFDASVEYDDFTCTMSAPEANAVTVERYLLKPAQVAQALEEQQLRVGTKQGLRALVDSLFAVHNHERQIKAAAEVEKEPDKRTSWDKMRMDLVLAAQLAVHCSELAKLVEKDEHDLGKGRISKHELKGRTKALLSQRAAGTVWQLRTWLQHFKNQIQQLRDEERTVQEQLRQLADAADKEKAGKGSSKENPKEKEDKLNLRQQQLLVKIVECENHAAQAQALHSKALTEAQGYPDLIRAYHSAEIGQTHPLMAAISQITIELLAPADPDGTGLAGQLREALQLARLTLFDMDVWVMGLVMLARRRVQASLWRNSQPAVVLALSTEALKKSLKEGISKSAEEELLAEEEKLKDSKQTQQQGKAAGKKKKKKGAAAKPAASSLMARLGADKDEDEDEEDDEERAAAERQRAEEEDAEQQAAAEGNGEMQGVEPHIDLSKLEPDMQGYERSDFQQPASKDTGSKDSWAGPQGSSTAASEPAAAAKATKEAAGKPAAAGAAAPAPAGAAARGSAARPASAAWPKGGSTSSSSNTRPAVDGAVPAWQKQKQQQQDDNYCLPPGGKPVCGTCGDEGHRHSACNTAYCEDCNKFGHAVGQCHSACRKCGRLEHISRNCTTPFCRECRLYGHFNSHCPHVKCQLCGKNGHMKAACPACPACRQPGHAAKDCTGYCTHCKVAGHRTQDCTVKRCSVCGQPGHTIGSPECPGQQTSSSSSSSTVAAAAGASRGGKPGSSSSSSRAQQAAVVSAPTAAPAAARKEPLRAGNIRLLAENHADKDLNRVVTVVMDGDVTYASELVSQPDKLSVLSRISAADLEAIVEQEGDKVGAFLDDVVTCHKASKLGSMVPKQLFQVRAARDAYLQELPQPLRGAIPSNWENTAVFAVLEGLIEKAGVAIKLQPQAIRHHMASARRAAQEAWSRHEAAKAQEQDKKEQQRQRRGGREGEHHTAVPAQGGQSSSTAGSRAAANQQQPAAVTTVSLSKVAAQATATATEPPSAPAAVSAPPGVVWQHPDQQQPMVPPSAPYATPAPPAPAEQVWAPGVQQQQQQQVGFAAPGAGLQPLAVHSFQGELAPWMLQHPEGARRAINEVVTNQGMREQLLTAVGSAQPGHLLEALQSTLMAIGSIIRAGQHEDGGFLRFAVMVQTAIKERQLLAAPQPSPVPQPAANLLLPHLRGGSYGAPAAPSQPQPAPVSAVIPLLPHLQQHHHQLPAAQWQGAPAGMQQQQQLDGAAEDGEESDEDELLGLLTGASTAAAQQQPAAWQVQPGQQQGSGQYSSADFPALNDDGQRISSNGRSGVTAVSAAGLANEAGEYNCFLNVVVQCLWACWDFRSMVWELPLSVAEDPVVSSLKRLFVQMQQAENAWQVGQDRIVVNPTELREALDAATHFRRQEMNDANELLDTLYECFKRAQPPGDQASRGSRGVLVDAVFGLLVNERVRCRRPGCGKQTHVIPSHWEHMLVVNTMALTFAAEEVQASGLGSDMGVLLRTLFDQEQKYCDKDEGGCGTPYAPERQCEIPPRVLTLQLVWDQDISGHDIGNALQHIQEAVDINRLYAGGVVTSNTTYQLSSAVAYYGQHYMAFVKNSKAGKWLLFDDAKVSEVGTWQDVIKKCISGKIQPSVLFYQGVDIAATPDTAQAGSRAAVGLPPGLPLPAPYAAAAATAPQQQLGPPAAAGSGSWSEPLTQQQPVHYAAGGPPLQPVPAAAPVPPAAAPAPGGAPWQQGQPAHRAPPAATPAAAAAPPAPAAGRPEPDGAGAPEAWHAVRQKPVDIAWGGEQAGAGPAPAAAAAAVGPPAAAAQTPAKPRAGTVVIAQAAIAQAVNQGASAAPGGSRGSGPRTTGPARGGDFQRGAEPHTRGGRGRGRA